MAAGNFANCDAVTLKEEGGWSNHPADPGGKTYQGVTQGTYDDYRTRRGLAKRSVALMTQAERNDIYKSGYWIPSGAEVLPMGVDLATYDASVNSGVSRGKKWAASSKDASPAKWVQKLCATRLSFVKSLKTWKNFGKGWSARIARIEAKGVSWALAAQGLSPQGVKNELNKESKAAQTKSNVAVGNAGVTGTGGGGVVLKSDDVAHQTGGVVLAVILVVIVLGVVYFAVRAHNNRQRAKAYKDEALQ